MLAKKFELDAMSADDLWLLHERLSGILSTQFRQKKHQLEKRMAILSCGWTWQIKSVACRCSVKGRGAGILWCCRSIGTRKPPKPGLGAASVRVG